MDLSLKGSPINRINRKDIKKCALSNAKQITDVPKKLYRKIAAKVIKSMSEGGNGLADLVPDLQKLGLELSLARALANDQTEKLYRDIDFLRMISVGITKYEWIYSGTGKCGHENFNGKVFRVKKPPFINDKNIPTRIRGCTCVIRPIVTFGENE